MADHLRQQIREAIATAVTGLTTTEARVYQSRVYPLESADLPGLLVFAESETCEISTMHTTPVLDRRLQLRIVGVAKATADLDDALDLICKEVEVALGSADVALAAIRTTLAFTGTQIEMQGDAEQPVGTATMTFEANYFTATNAPDVAL